MADFYWLPYFDDEWYEYFNDTKRLNAKVLPFVNGRKARSIRKTEVDGSDKQIKEELSYSYDLALNKVINLSAHQNSNIKERSGHKLNIKDSSWSDINFNIFLGPNYFRLCLHSRIPFAL